LVPIDDPFSRLLLPSKSIPMKYRKLKFVRRSPYRPGDKVTLSPLRDDSGQVVAFTGVACVVDVLNDVASHTREIIHSHVTISISE
jgi:hypothetical protein